MNKLQTLLTAGLLSLTSVSFASLVTIDTSTAGDIYTGTAIHGGSIVLDVNQPERFSDSFRNDNDDLTTSDTSLYYEFKINSGAESVGSVFNVIETDPVKVGVVGIEIYDDISMSALSLVLSADNKFATSLLSNGVQYYMVLTGQENTGFTADVSAVPVPAAGILFASALFGAGALGRRKKKAKASVVGAFARAS